jgi:hypothetical protein
VEGIFQVSLLKHSTLQLATYRLSELDLPCRIMEVDEGPTLGPDNEQHGKDISNTITDDTYCTGEDATNMVKIRSVEAGRLVFDLWYEAAQVPPQLCTYVPSQPLASDGAPSSPSDLYGTFPSTQVG